MRLLDVSTYLLYDTSGSIIPNYAILSHRWMTEEVTFRDLQDDPNFLTHKSTRNRAGAVKIRRVCQLAAAAGLHYVWVDTCCIDKSSSHEVSVAVNSMFWWYREAKLCIVYLADVQGAADDLQLTLESFERSNWFKRGWTLQELVAPLTIDFYDCSWTLIGNKKTLQHSIEVASGIQHSDFLYFETYPNVDSFDLNRPSMARRLSWAARRQTTHPEDMAYCLLGLCRIHMPLLYGEGAIEAFNRLQIAILNTHDDGTVLAWNRATVTPRQSLGFLAESPADFLDAGNVFLSGASVRPDRPPFTITPRGLLTTSNLWYSAEVSGFRHKHLPLRCADAGRHVFLQLVEAPDHHAKFAKHLYFRAGPLFKSSCPKDLLTEHGTAETAYLARRGRLTAVAAKL